MRNLDLLADRIRADGIASGWDPVMPHEWATSDGRVPTFLALIHSEICEAYAETCSDENYAFPSLLDSEFADIQIRTLDLAGGLTFNFEFYVKAARIDGDDMPCDRSLAFLALHQNVTDALEAFRRDDRSLFLRALGRLYDTVQFMATKYYYIDLDQAIDDKMAFNRQRSRRNGGKRV